VTENRLDVQDRAAWRVWLASHHASEEEVCLVYHKGSAIGISYGDSVEEALCFGWIGGLIRSIDDTTYMRRFTPRRPGSRWSASNKRRVERLLETGLMEEAGLVAINAAKADESWDQLSDAERDWDMPAELEEILARADEARDLFESCSPSHRRQFVMWVASAKRPETRVRRARRAVEMLLDGARPT
jgi:uncharacterized protein YdeI (YjbR/CyaY-like superfamily)